MTARWFGGAFLFTPLTSPFFCVVWDAAPWWVRGNFKAPVKERWASQISSPGERELILLLRLAGTQHKWDLVTVWQDQRRTFVSFSPLFHHPQRFRPKWWSILCTKLTVITGKKLALKCWAENYTSIMNNAARGIVIFLNYSTQCWRRFLKKKKHKSTRNIKSNQCFLKEADS